MENELRSAIKDLGLEISGGDFTKEIYESAVQTFTSIIAAHDQAMKEKLLDFGAQNFLFAVQEWYKTQNDEDTLQIALQVLHEVQNQKNQA